jgi:hypothetical protein
MVKLTLTGKMVSQSQYAIRLVDEKEYTKYSKYLSKLHTRKKCSISLKQKKELICSINNHQNGLLLSFIIINLKILKHKTLVVGISSV